MKPIFETQDEAIKWVGLNIPWAVKPKKKTDSIKFINPFTSVHAHDVVVETLGKQFFKLQQKQHLIDIMKGDEGLRLYELEEKLDIALKNETSESLTNWLKEKRNTMDKEQLLEYCHANAKDYIYLTSQREYDCLIALVEDGDITTFRDLANYGMETIFLKNEITK